MKLSGGQVVFLMAMVAFSTIAVTQAVGISPKGTAAGDWLQFAGSLIGVTLTIGGAVYIEERRRNSSEQERAKRISGILDDLQEAFTLLDAAPWDGTYAGGVKAPILRDIKKALQQLNFMQTSESSNYEVWLALHEILQESEDNLENRRMGGYRTASRQIFPKIQIARKALRHRA